MKTLFRACLLAGLPVSLLSLAGLAALLTFAELPLQYYAAAAALPLMAGCFAAGFSAGRRLRHGGIRNGSTAALLLSALWYAADCADCGEMRSPALLLVLLPCGICGGICGVNTPLPKPHRRLHGSRRMKEDLKLRRKLLHRPKNAVISSKVQQPDLCK